MYEHSETARQAVADCRAILNQPDPAARAWDERLTIHERHTILRAAGLDRGRANKAWRKLQPTERRRIQEAARRASQWARELCAGGLA